MHSSVHGIDYVVLVCYLLLMAGIGAYFMRFMRVGADFLKGGNRVEWWWPVWRRSCLVFPSGHLREAQASLTGTASLASS